MPRGRSSPPTPLPSDFTSWRHLYDEWEKFRTSEPRTAKPSRAERFAALHNMPDWIVGTVPYIFRAGERQDAVGEYARRIITLIESNKMGVPKANNEIRAFQMQDPMFRGREVQLKALEETTKRLRDLSVLTHSVRNFSPEITTDELEEAFEKLSVQVRKIQQLKNRIARALKEREEES